VPKRPNSTPGKKNRRPDGLLSCCGAAAIAEALGIGPVSVYRAPEVGIVAARCGSRHLPISDQWLAGFPRTDKYAHDADAKEAGEVSCLPDFSQC
jgi:hypothetical protein